ncbi:MAG: S41 family peptidase [Gemmatimonadaceae bacterium]|nr:S41 family peptidase [Gemmatimonadaceae bacterium]
MNLRRSLTVATVLGVALGTGGWLMGRSLRTDEPTVVDGRRLFSQVLDAVQNRFVDSLPPDSLWHMATLGMVDELHDPHSVFLVADRLSRFREQTTGQYAGLGLRVDVRDGWITVIAPLPGSPSEAAGLMTGDRVVRIDAMDTKGLTSEEALLKLRGAAGSRVVLTVERLGVDGRLTFTLTRQVIRVSAVQRIAMLPSRVGYLDVSVFSDSTAEEVAAGVDSLLALGMASLVLDLRGNPGGLVQQGAAVSDLFLDPGQEIVTLRGRTPESNQTFTDKLPQKWPSLPIVVLVDRGSASAAEIVAGALQDHDRAVVVGSTTYGKGSAQSVFEAGPTGALKLTTSLWFTPVGRSISIRHATMEPVAPRRAAAAPDSLTSEVDSMVAKRKAFRTDKGRIVYGGGGITPDVLARDSAAIEQGAILQSVLGRAVPTFRDALTALALSLKSSGALSSTTFAVTPAMRAELLAGVRARGAVVADSAFEENAAVVDRLIGYEVTRYVFGRDAEFSRRTADDPVMQRALTLLRDAPGRDALLVRASAEHPSKAGGRS